MISKTNIYKLRVSMTETIIRDLLYEIIIPVFNYYLKKTKKIVKSI